MITHTKLDHELVVATFDPETAIALIDYRGALDAEASAAAYNWLQDLLEKIGSEALFGEIFDFRRVTQFKTDNLIDARKHSRRMNLMMETYYFPVAMVVGNAMQEEILRGPMRVMPGNPRKRIVYEMDDAVAFIQSWHQGGAGSA